MKNALEATPRAVPVEVSLARRGARLDLSVRNHGEVPEAIRGRFFQKHVTAGKSRGTGLGAYSARLIAEAHGGSVELDASEPGWTTVRLRLPLAAGKG
jgi:signal transduction histidine kinase